MDNKLSAEHYSQNSKLQKKIALDIMYYHKFSNNEKILDIGCGDGEITKLLSEYGEALGVDSCKNMIDFANKKNITATTKYLNSAFLELNEQNKYSLITAFNSIYWCGDLNKIFRKIYSILEDKGRFLIVTYPKESPYWLPIISLLKSNKWEKWQNSSIDRLWLTTDEYITLINNHNLKLLRYDITIENINYKSLNEYINYLHGWLPLMFATTFPIDDFIKDLVKTVWEDNKEVNIKYKKVILYGER